MIALKKYILKLGDFEFPEKYIRADTYKSYVNMQDVNPYTDANGYLHRNPVQLKALKVELETIPMNRSEFETLMENIRAQYTNEAGRELTIEAYVMSEGKYISQKGYVADIQPTVYGTFDGWIIDPVKFSFIGGVA